MRAFQQYQEHTQIAYFSSFDLNEFLVKICEIWQFFAIFEIPRISRSLNLNFFKYFD
jgi:hypothetical protein